MIEFLFADDITQWQDTEGKGPKSRALHVPQMVGEDKEPLPVYSARPFLFK